MTRLYGEITEARFVALSRARPRPISERPRHAARARRMENGRVVVSWPEFDPPLIGVRAYTQAQMRIRARADDEARRIRLGAP